MKILYAASEALPFMASGGLADVAGSLPKAIRNRMHACRVVMPLYGDIAPELRAKMKYVTNFTVALAWRRQYCGVFECTIDGVIYYFLDNEYYFKRNGIYGFYDDGERFAFFAKAILEMVNFIDFDPEIIHCNDWQTALVPVYLNLFYRNIPKFKRIKTVFTIHNIQYQGKYGMDIVTDLLGIPQYASTVVECDGCVNYMKGAIIQADMVTTVSPTYAEEILDPWFSHGLDPVLRNKRHRLRGILNGIDVKNYDPETDPDIIQNFSAAEPELKKQNKAALQREFGLPVEEDKMLIGIVSRLVAHKGLDLIKYIMEDLLQLDVQIAVLGSGDYLYENFFTEMQARNPDQIAVRLGFIPAAARQVYAGADAFLMPSKSEPCGLSQMLALRYGAIPIVRETGGLKDSITDFGEEEGNGFTFKTYNAHDMLGAIVRCKEKFDDKPEWEQMVKHALECDCSWGKSANEYIKMYKEVLGVE
ncbi:glycogen synthase GlgA [Hydrogenoanaerobacterium sp.]|uniref:glycogen synthase GlgA n=1 Tax=Hydrogenoanaerobacterium sp. TaxID=2953763 RepID=UPI0028A03A04|nr:glycogen synthase GlgA [Hydrogenoanaerobacterium sp.]